jgi:hypothetical protein
MLTLSSGSENDIVTKVSPALHVLMIHLGRSDRTSIDWPAEKSQRMALNFGKTLYWSHQRDARICSKSRNVDKVLIV